MTNSVPFPSYVVTVNYGQTIERLIHSGKYDWICEGKITSDHYPSGERGYVEVLVYLVNFGYFIHSEGVVKELNKWGMRPATVKEILTLGFQHPDLQRHDKILALGSTWLDSRGDVNSPYLWGRDGRRWLSIGSSPWAEDYLFAAVCK